MKFPNFLPLALGTITLALHHPQIIASGTVIEASASTAITAAITFATTVGAARPTFQQIRPRTEGVPMPEFVKDLWSISTSPADATGATASLPRTTAIAVATTFETIVFRPAISHNEPILPRSEQEEESDETHSASSALSIDMHSFRHGPKVFSLATRTEEKPQTDATTTTPPAVKFNANRSKALSNHRPTQARAADLTAMQSFPNKPMARVTAVAVPHGTERHPGAGIFRPHSLITRRARSEDEDETAVTALSTAAATLTPLTPMPVFRGGRPHFFRSSAGEEGSSSSASSVVATAGTTTETPDWEHMYRGGWDY